MTKDRLVYSTETGRVCPECQKPITLCICREIKSSEISGDGKVLLRRETKGRGGKTVIVISGLALTKNQLQALLKELKRLCGTGGTLKGNALEVQGEHLDTIREYLRGKGYQPKG